MRTPVSVLRSSSPAQSRVDCRLGKQTRIKLLVQRQRTYEVSIYNRFLGIHLYAAYSVLLPDGPLLKLTTRRSSYGLQLKFPGSPR